MERGDWIKVFVAAFLMVISFAISYVAVTVLEPVMLFLAFLALTYLGYRLFRILVPTPTETSTVVAIIVAAVASALIVWTCTPIIKLLLIIALAWILFRFLSKKFARTIEEDMREVFGGG